MAPMDRTACRTAPLRLARGIRCLRVMPKFFWDGLEAPIRCPRLCDANAVGLRCRRVMPNFFLGAAFMCRLTVHTTSSMIAIVVVTTSAIRRETKKHSKGLVVGSVHCLAVLVGSFAKARLYGETGHAQIFFGNGLFSRISRGFVQDSMLCFRLYLPRGGLQ